MRLRSASRRILLAASIGMTLCLQTTPLRAAAPVPPVPLQQIAAIHRLSMDLAAQRLPVDLTGVVTAFSGFQDFFFLQDATGAVAINRDEHTLVHAGDRVRVIGTTQTGRFAPAVTTSKVTVLGRGTLPEAHRQSFEDLQGGTEDSHWIEIRGIVRSSRVETVWDHPALVLRVEMGGGQIAVHLLDFEAKDVSGLVDAVIRVRGACGTVFNEKRQFTGLRLFAQSMANLTVEQAAPTDPFATASRSIKNVLQFEPNTRPGHRVKVAGVVTLQHPGHSLFIQDGHAGIEVLTEDAAIVTPGSRIEAVGFPRLGAFAPVLQDATIRVVGTEEPPLPIMVGKDGLLRRDDYMSFVPMEDQLVRVEGVVVDTRAEARFVWTLRVGNATVIALLRPDPALAPLPVIEPGSSVSVTGVLTVEVDSDDQPRYFRVLLRSPADIVVLKRASWWTPAHLFATLAVSLGAILGILLWGITLRQRVRQQTAQLRQSEERFRLQAQTDALTGLASRSFFHEQLRAAIREADETRSGIAVMMLDLDFFKQVNDTLGHHAGDQLLCIVADRLRSAVRKEDLVARLGGDEFIVLLQPLARAANLEALGSIVVRAVCTQAEIAGQPLQVSASVGLCAYPAHAHDFASLLQNVDSAMYRAKAAGRNSFAIFEPAGRLNRKSAHPAREVIPSSRLPVAAALSTSAGDGPARQA